MHGCLSLFKVAINYLAMIAIHCACQIGPCDPKYFTSIYAILSVAYHNLPICNLILGLTLFTESCSDDYQRCGLSISKLVLLILLHILQFVSVLVQKVHISSNLNFLSPSDEIRFRSGNKLKIEVLKLIRKQVHLPRGRRGKILL